MDLSNLRALIVAGPLMPEEDYLRLKGGVEEFGDQINLFRHVQRFEDWIRASDAVISMGGYNTLREVAALGKPNLVVPRVYPRVEQLMRARYFEANGWCEISMMGDSTSAGIGDFCRRLSAGNLSPCENALECRGFDSLIEEIRALESVGAPNVARVESGYEGRLTVQ